MDAESASEFFKRLMQVKKSHPLVCLQNLIKEFETKIPRKETITFLQIFPAFSPEYHAFIERFMRHGEISLTPYDEIERSPSDAKKLFSIACRIYPLLVVNRYKAIHKVGAPDTPSGKSRNFKAKYFSNSANRRPFENTVELASREILSLSRNGIRLSDISSFKNLSDDDINMLQTHIGDIAADINLDYLATAQWIKFFGKSPKGLVNFSFKHMLTTFRKKVMIN